MPFPFASLPYGHLRRLRELATPVEVYDIQLAVGNNVDGLLPLQPAKNIPYLLAPKDSDSAVWKFDKDSGHGSPIRVMDVVLIVADICLDVEINELCKILYIKNVRELTVINDCLTVDLLRFFAYQMPNITGLFINYPLRNVKLFDVLSIFSKLCVLQAKTTYHGWMHDLVEADPKNMNIYFYNEDTFDDVFSFNPDDLLQLLNNSCGIAVDCKNSYNETFDTQIEKISAYLGPSFTINTTSVSLPSFTVVLHNSESDIHIRKVNNVRFGSQEFLLKSFVPRALLEAQVKCNTDIQNEPSSQPHRQTQVMPFPYAKLPYGQLRRLRELSTPVEVYDLQLAVGNQLDGLLPLQSTKNVHDVFFTTDAAMPVQVYTHIDDEMPTFITANVVFIVKRISVRYLFNKKSDIKSNAMANAAFDTLYLKNARKLSTVTDGLTVEFLQFFGHQVPHLTELTFDGLLYNVKLSDILAIFKKRRVLEVQNINHGWVRDLLNADACNIKIAVYGEENSFENIFSFNPTDLLQLLNKRCNISLICKNPYNETFEAQTAKISEYLGPSFMRLTTFVPLPNFAVGLKCILEPSGPDSFVRTTCIRFVSRALFEANGFVQSDVGFNFAESEI